MAEEANKESIDPTTSAAATASQGYQARVIPVSQFEMTLAWPIFLQVKKGEDGKLIAPELDPNMPGFLQRWSDHICRRSKECWKLVNPFFEKDTGPLSAAQYSEFCYFHPFVRNFLYTTRGDVRDYRRKFKNSDCDAKLAPNRNMSILKREDIAEGRSYLDIYHRLEKGGQWIDYRTRFDFVSCWMYLFDTQVAVVETQLRYNKTCLDSDGKLFEDLQTEQQLSLEIVLQLQDIVRRVYAAYWEVNVDKGVLKVTNDHVPKSIDLVIDQKVMATEFGVFQTVSASADQINAATEGDFTSLRKLVGDKAESIGKQKSYVRQHREPPVVDLWKTLLAPLDHVKEESDNEQHRSSLQFEQIQDDRIPLLAYIAVGDEHDENDENENDENDKKTCWVRKISEPDWFRLAALDDPGDSHQSPYSPSFLAQPEYDLSNFCYDRFWHPEPPKPPGDDYFTTRWLTSSHAFIGVGAANSWFFRNEKSGALCHYRNHYFALFLIALFQRASLLKFKHRLAEISDEMLEDEKPHDLIQYQFQTEANQLSKEFMRFRTLYWFCEVSNQIQPTELFAKLRTHMNLQNIFTDVSADLEAADSLVRIWEQEAQSRNGLNLAFVGGLFALAAPAMVVVSAVVSSPIGAWDAILILGCSSIFAGILLLFLEFPVWWTIVRCSMRMYPRLFSRMARRMLAGALLILGCLAMAMVVFFGQTAAPKPSPKQPSSVSGRVKQQVVVSTTGLIRNGFYENREG